MSRYANPRPRISLMILSVILSVCFCFSALAEEASVDDADVDRAIERAAAFLWKMQDRDGHWHSTRTSEVHPFGTDALVMYALWASDTGMNPGRYQPAITALLDRVEVGSVFTRSYSLLLWTATDPDRFRREIDDDVRFLKLQQDDSGAWGYGATVPAPSPDWRDNRHSALALYALEQAAWVDASVPDAVWRRAERYWLNEQNPDGGWSFQPRHTGGKMQSPAGSYGTMTAAGLASLYVTYDQLHRDAALGFNGRFKARCGEENEETHAILSAMARGHGWFDTRFRVDRVADFKGGGSGDPRDGALPLYQSHVTRMGRLSGHKRIGSSNWYREIARHLIRAQQVDGAWGDVESTCYGILALAHARGPIVLNKLRYGDGDDWATDPHDADHVSRWVSRRWGMDAAWQICDLRNHPEDILDAPVLLITGHEAPELSPRERDALRTFIRAGGTIMAAACCSREAFVAGCRELFASLLPDHQVGLLPDDHPVWDIGDEIVRRDGVMGLSDGCRTNVFILPDAPCCAWQQMLTRDHVRSFLLADNILRYAVYERPLGGRLTPCFERPTDGRASHRISVARLRHDGDWNTDPDALDYLSSWMGDRFDVRLDIVPPVTGYDARPGLVDALWLTGHTFDLPQSADAAALRSFLQAGGTLMATACCGSESFDRSFREFVASQFGEDAWRPVLADDPIMAGKAGLPRPASLTDVSFRSRLKALPPARLDRPRLLGVRQDDRWMILYSQSDLNCGLTGHSCPTCVGYVSADARRIAANLFLYAGNSSENEKGEAPEAEGRDEP